MNIDSAGIIRGQLVIQPEVIGEPGVTATDTDEVSASGVVQPVFGHSFFFENLFDTGNAFQQSGDLVSVRVIFYIHVSYLMVGHRECSRSTAVHGFPAQRLFADSQ